MKKKIFQHLRRWHRRLGISAAIFILFLSASGVVLNHSDDLSLTHRFVNSEFVWNLYGIKGPETIIAFNLEGKKIIAVDKQIWLDNHLILESAGTLKSAVIFNGIIVAILNQELLLMTNDGEIIERMDSSAGIPQKINYLATSADKIWLETDVGLFVSDEQLLNWQLVESNACPEKPVALVLSKNEKQKIESNFNSRLISWERVLMDIHSGRILGKTGTLFADLVALLLILLSLSGIYMWLRSTKARHSKK